MSKQIDCDFVMHGSLVLAQPQTIEAGAWLRDNCDTEGYQWLGPNLAIEHRYAQQIAEGMLADGLRVTLNGRRIMLPEQQMSDYLVTSH